jgi:hypothetical protein
MEPQFNLVADNPPLDVNVANVKCQADNELCVSVGIKAFPVIRFYKNGFFFFFIWVN